MKPTERHLHAAAFRQCARVVVAAGLVALACSSGTARAQAGGTLYDIANELKQLRDQVNASVQIPVGAMIPYGGDLTSEASRKALLDKGWLLCDGGALSIDDYDALYKVIGLAFGGDKNNKRFNLPDARGRFLRGTDIGSKNDPDAGQRVASAPGGNTGDKVGSKQDDALASHKHSVHAEHAGVTARGESSGDPLALAGFPKYAATKDVDAFGGNETRPKNIAVNWIIKAKDVKAQ